MHLVLTCFKGLPLFGHVSHACDHVGMLENWGKLTRDPRRGRGHTHGIHIPPAVLSAWTSLKLPGNQCKRIR